MEEKNEGVDLSNYVGLQKRGDSGKKPGNNKKNPKKNKIYLLVIIFCLLAMAILWGNYFLNNQ